MFSLYVVIVVTTSIYPSVYQLWSRLEAGIFRGIRTGSPRMPSEKQTLNRLVDYTENSGLTLSSTKLYVFPNLDQYNIVIM